MQVVNNTNHIINMSISRRKSDFLVLWIWRTSMYSEANLQHPSITWPLCIKITFVSPTTQIRDIMIRTVTIFSSVNPRTLKSHLHRNFRQPFKYVSEIKLIAPLFYTPKLILLPALCFFFITRQNVVQTCKQWTHLRSLIPGRIKNCSIQHNLNTANTSGTGERYR